MPHLNTGTWIDSLNTDVIPYLYDKEYDYYYPTKSMLEIKNKDLLISYAQEAYKQIIKEVQFDFERDDPFIFRNEFVFKKIMTKEDLYSNILRFDFVRTLDNDYKLIEANADTPCAIPETFYGNFIAIPNQDKENVANKRLAEIFINECNKVELKHNYTTINIAFAASDEYIEDWANAQYLYENFKRFNTHKEYNAFLVPLSQLAIYDDDKRCGVYFEDNMIDVLYRLHPVEMMINDISEDGYSVGLKLIEFHYNDIVKLINPPGSIFLQNKELFKYLFGMSFIPKTLNGSSQFNRKVIAKPIFGREGDGIQIFNNMNECRNRLYKLSDYLIQEYIEQPTEQIETVNRDILNAYITYSIFMLNGYPSVLYTRASVNPVCGVDAFWIPCY